MVEGQGREDGLRVTRDEVVPREQPVRRVVRALARPACDVPGGVRVDQDRGDECRGEPLTDLVHRVRPVDADALVLGRIHPDEDAGAQLCEAVQHGRWGQIGGALRPDRADRCCGEQPDHRVLAGRQAADDAVPAPHPQIRQRSGEARGPVTQLRPGDDLPGAVLLEADQGLGVVLAVRQRGLRVVERRAGEPAGARHRPLLEHVLPRGVRGDVEEVPDRLPVLLDARGRPAPEGVVVLGTLQSQPVPFLDEPVERAVGGLVDLVGAGEPEGPGIVGVRHRTPFGTVLLPPTVERVVTVGDSGEDHLCEAAVAVLDTPAARRSPGCASGALLRFRV